MISRASPFPFAPYQLITTHYKLLTTNNIYITITNITDVAYYC